MSISRPKPEDDLDRLQAEFLQSQSRPSATIIRTSKSADTYNPPQVNERVTLDAVDEEEEDEEEEEEEEDAAGRLDEYESRALPSVVARVMEREIHSSVLPLVSAYPSSGFPSSALVSSASATLPSSEGKKSLFAQNLLRKRQLATAGQNVGSVTIASTITQPSTSKSAQSSNSSSLSAPKASTLKAGNENTNQSTSQSSKTNPDGTRRGILKASSSSTVVPPASTLTTAVVGPFQPSNLLSALSVADQRTIQVGNEKALAGMSEDEVLEAQREIESLLSPDLIAMIRRRNAVAAPAVEAAKKAQSAAPADFKAQKAAQAFITSSDANMSPADLLQNFLDSKKPPEEGLTEQEWEELGEQKKEWMKPLSEEECAHKDSGWEHWRVDFDGIPVHGKNIPLHKGLHHHGDEPGVAGYNLTELIRLCRSTVPAQRAVALNVLTRVLERSRQGLYVEKRPEDPDSLIRQVILAGFSPELRTQPGGGPINYSQALANHLLQLNLTVIVRCGIDDSNITAQRAALEALRALMYVKYTDNDHGWEITRGYERTFTTELAKEVDLTAITLDNLMTGILQTQVLSRFRFILECVNEVSLHRCVIDCLLMVARHSPQACELIFLTPRMALVLSKLIMKIIAVRDASSATVPSAHRTMLLGEGLLTLLCLLCASSVKICTHFVESGLMLQLKRLIVTSIGLAGAVLAFPEDLSSTDIILSVCALRCWRISLCFHLETSLFLDTFPVLCKAVMLQVPQNHPHLKLLRLQTRAIYNIFDLACVLAGSGRIEEVKGQNGIERGEQTGSHGKAGGDIGWTQVAIAVEQALSVVASFFEREQMDEEDTLILAGVLRLLGTYFALLPLQPEFIAVHTKIQATQLLQRWFVTQPTAIRSILSELTTSTTTPTSVTITPTHSSTSTEIPTISCLYCSSTCPQTSNKRDAKTDVLYNYYRFLHSLLLLLESGSWNNSTIPLSSLVETICHGKELTKMEALLAYEICTVSQLLGVSSFALSLRVFPFMISHGNIHLAKEILDSIVKLGPYEGETLVRRPTHTKEQQHHQQLLQDDYKQGLENTVQQPQQQLGISEKAWQKSAQLVFGWLLASFEQTDLMHAQQLSELDGLSSLFVREPLTPFKNDSFYLFWPLPQLFSIEDTQHKVEQVNEYLHFLCGLPSTNVSNSPLWATALLRTLMRIYEMGSEVFLAVRTYHVPLLQSLLHPPHLDLSASAGTLSSPLYDFDALPDARFYPVFENLVSMYSQDSWGDPLFGECILLLLGMSYAPAYRQLIWSELQAVFRVMPPILPLHETCYLYPIETNIKVLKLYEESLCGRQKLPPMFEQIALHHFSSSLQNSSQKAIERFRQEASPSLWETVSKFQKSNSISASTPFNSSICAASTSSSPSHCICCSKLLVWQDEGAWKCWFCDPTNSSKWKCSRC